MTISVIPIHPFTDYEINLSGDVGGSKVRGKWFDTSVSKQRERDRISQLRRKYPGFYRQFGMTDYRRIQRFKNWLSSIKSWVPITVLGSLLVILFTYMVYEGKRPLNPDYVPTPELSRSVKQEIDRRVAEAGQYQFNDYPELTDFLVEPYTDEHERFYSIYRWVTSNISYDVDSYREDHITAEENYPDSVFERRLAVCDGYSKLLAAMSSYAGLDIEYVSGRGTAGQGRVASIDNSSEGHAWNIVRINSYWYPVDSTWDAGGVNNQKTKFTRNNWGYRYFLISPDQFNQDHKAMEPNKNLLNDIELNDIDLIWFNLLEGRSFVEFLKE